MRKLLLLVCVLVSCHRPVPTASYNGKNFHCKHPDDWHVVTYEDQADSARVEFDFPGPGFATVIVFTPDNQTAFTRYTATTLEKFPAIHERDYPDQKVSILDARTKGKLGGLDVVLNRFAIKVGTQQIPCTFSCVDLTTPESVMLVDVFDEGTPINATTAAALQQFISTIVPCHPKNTTGAPD